MLTREAEFYRALSGEPVEYPPDAIDLGSYHEQSRRRRPPVSVAAAIGALLASLHRMPLKLLPPRHSQPPFLTPHRPAPGHLGTAGTALDLIRIVKGTTGFGERLDAVAATWSSIAPTHQDLSGGTILVRGRRPRVTLVGWESAGPGDPRWDIGSVLAHYLTLWISSIPDSSLSARRPLETVQPAMRACWHGYADAMGMKGEAPQRFLATTMPFAAVRLVRAALESAQTSPRPTAAQLLHLQVAHNILERPYESAAQLFLSAGSGRRPAG